MASLRELGKFLVATRFGPCGPDVGRSGMLGELLVFGTAADAGGGASGYG